MRLVNRLRGIGKVGVIGLALASPVYGGESEYSAQNKADPIMKIESGGSKLEDRIEVIPTPPGEPISGTPEPSRKTDLRNADSRDLKLPNGDFLKSENSFYDDNKELFYINGRAQIGNLEIGSADPKNQKAYLFFDGEEHPEFSEPYISLGNKDNFHLFSTGSPKGKIGPSIEFLKGNRYGGVEIEDNDKFVIQTRGGHVTVKNRIHSMKIPKVTTKGYFYIVAGNQLIRFEQGLKEPYKDSKVRVNGVELRGFSTAPMQIESLDDNGNRLIKNLEIIITDDNKIEPVSIQYADKLAAIGRKGTPVSPWIGFYELNASERMKFTNLSKESQWNLIQYSPDYIKGFLLGYQPGQNTLVQKDNIQGDNVQREVQETQGYIAVHPSVVSYWKKNKEAELRKKYGRNIIVEPEMRGSDKDGYIYVSLGLIDEWKKYTIEEIWRKNPNLKGKPIAIDPVMKRP